MGIQDERCLLFDCPLDKDALLIRSIEGSERLGSCFVYDVTLYSLDRNIEAEKLLGQPATVRIQFARQEPRFLNGIACEFAPIGHEGRYATYHLVLRPWLWLLSRNSNCRIYQRKTAREIILDILSKRGCPAVDDKLTYALQEREYCVQYRESDLHFITRLMEDEGLYFYFRHEAGKHVLVLADSLSAHSPVSGLETLHYHRDSASASEDDAPRVTRWTSRKQLQAGKVELRDYDFEKPLADTQAHSDDPREHEHADEEVYDYPGGYRDVHVGNDRARVRLQAILAEYETSHGTTNAAALFTGALFTLADHPREVENRQYLIQARSFHADSGGFESGSSDAPRFDASVEALDTRTQFRPKPSAHHPVVTGPQTATVVGPKTSEIATDNYGRVKVRFHWDREDNEDSEASCFIRVAQLWAGSGWGAQFIPRVGQEVVVDFLEGDPDRPVITGCLYNGSNKTPYDLPKDRTQSGIKTRSTQQGGPDAYNELRFEDRKGSEQLVLHAQRDLSVTARHDSRISVGNDEQHLVDGSRVVSIGKAESHQVEKSLKLTVGTEYKVWSQKTISEGAVDEIKLTVGASELTIDKTGITLTVGGSVVKLDQSGVSVTGVMVKINS
jgi:type VI secretion system secreted protein VgrG